MFCSFLAFLGRALISLIFIFAAIQKVLDWEGTEQLLKHTLTQWETLASGASWLEALVHWSLENVQMLLWVIFFLELIGGLLVFLGITVRLGSFLLLCFLVPTTLIVHHFWDLAEPERQVQMVNFMKNISIMGGLLFILARGKGDVSSTSDQKPS